MEFIIDDSKRVYFFLCCIPGFNGNIGRSVLPFFPNIKSKSATAESLSHIMSPSLVEKILLAKNKYMPDSTWTKIDSMLHEMHKNKVRFFTCEDEDFPDKLKDIPDPPIGIFCKGKIFDSPLIKPSVAIIGARECSEYGRHIASELGAYLGKAGITVISGMARGIDGISQQSALDAGGKSIAVLGSGVNVCYPASNRGLYEKLLINGGVMSLVPPDEKALPYNFPPRNRIVSGLADSIVVIEARQKSGTLITVDMALEQGREVFAVPGRITDRLSDGCNGLIGQGASIFLSPEIFVEEFLSSRGLIEFDKNKRHKKHRTFDGSAPIPIGITNEQLPIYKALEYLPLSIDEILGRLGDAYDYSYVSMILMQLCIDGYILQSGPQSFVLK